MSDKALVTVCDNCLRAGCWQDGLFCNNYLTAGTIEKTMDELRVLNLESPKYWDPSRFPSDFLDHHYGQTVNRGE